MADQRALVIDVDGTLCPVKPEGTHYGDLRPHRVMVDRLKQWHADGYRIILYTARNMRSYDGNLGLINKHTAPALIAWLDKWGIPYDELHFGKPWPGRDGFYVDDRAIRPDEFVKLSAGEIRALLTRARRALEPESVESL